MEMECNAMAFLSSNIRVILVKITGANTTFPILLNYAGHILNYAGHVLNYAGHVWNNAAHVLNNAGHILNYAGHILNYAGHILNYAGHVPFETVAVPLLQNERIRPDSSLY